MDIQGGSQPSGSTVERNVIDFLAHRKSATKFIHGNTYEYEAGEKGCPRVQPPPTRWSYICNKCGQPFVDCAGLEIHSRVCDKIFVANKPFSCNLCDKTYDNINHLKIHTKVQHLDQESGHYCEKVKDIRYTEFRSSKPNDTSCSENEPLSDVVVVSKTEIRIVSVVDAPMDEIEKGGKLYKCSVCGLSSDMTANLYKHMKNMHPDFSIVHRRTISKRMKDIFALKNKSKSPKDSKPLQNGKVESFSTGTTGIAGRGLAHKGDSQMMDQRQHSKQFANDLSGLSAETVGVSNITPAMPVLYQCSVCHKKIADGTEYSSHLRSHKIKSEWNHRQKTDLPQVSVQKFGASNVVPPAAMMYQCSVCLQKFADETNCSNHLKSHESKSVWDYSVPSQVGKDETGSESSALQNVNSEKKVLYDKIQLESDIGLDTTSIDCYDKKVENGELSRKGDVSGLQSDEDDEEVSSVEDSFSKSVELEILKVGGKCLGSAHAHDNKNDSFTEGSYSDSCLNQSEIILLDGSKESFDDSTPQKFDLPAKDSNISEKEYDDQSNQKTKCNKVTVLSILKPVTNTVQSGEEKTVYKICESKRQGIIRQKADISASQSSFSETSNIVRVVDIPPIGNHRYKCSACNLTSNCTSNLYHHMKASHKDMTIMKRRNAATEKKGEYSSNDSNHEHASVKNRSIRNYCADLENSCGFSKDNNENAEFAPETFPNEDHELDIDDSHNYSGNSNSSKTVQIIINPNSKDYSQYKCSKCAFASSDTVCLYQHMANMHKDLAIVRVKTKGNPVREIFGDSSSKMLYKGKTVRVIDIPKEGSHRYKCSACFRTSNSSGNLYEHMRRVHKKYKIVLRRDKNAMDDDCLISGMEMTCENASDEENGSKIHVIDIPTGEGDCIHKCSECDYSGRDISNMYKHMRRMHKGMEILQRIRKKKRSAFELSQCKKRSALKLTQNQSKKRAAFGLAQCKKRRSAFKQCKNERYHDYSGENGVKAPDWGGTKNKDSELSIIEYFCTEEGSRQYTCSKCYEIFYDIQNAQSHMMSAHKGMKFISKVQMPSGELITQRKSSRRSVLDKSKTVRHALTLSDHDDGHSDDDSDWDASDMIDIKSPRRRQFNCYRCDTTYCDSGSFSRHVRKAHEIVPNKQMKGCKVKHIAKKKYRKSLADSDNLDSKYDEILQTFDISDGRDSNDEHKKARKEGNKIGDTNEGLDTVCILDIALTKAGHRFKCSRCGFTCRTTSNLNKHMKRMHKDLRIMGRKCGGKHECSEISRKDADCFANNDDGNSIICDSGLNLNQSECLAVDDSVNEEVNRNGSDNEELRPTNARIERIKHEGVSLFKMTLPLNKNYPGRVEDESVSINEKCKSTKTFNFNSQKFVERVHQGLGKIEKKRKSRRVFDRPHFDNEDFINDDESSDTVRIIDIPPTEDGHKFKCSRCDAVSRNTSNLNKHMQRMHKDFRILYRKRGRKFQSNSLNNRHKNIKNSFENRDDIPEESIEVRERSRPQGELKLNHMNGFFEFSASDDHEDTDSSITTGNSQTDGEMIMLTSTETERVSHEGVTMLKMAPPTNKSFSIRMQEKNMLSLESDDKNNLYADQSEDIESYTMTSSGDGAKHGAGIVSKTHIIDIDTSQEGNGSVDNVVQAIRLVTSGGQHLHKCSECGYISPHSRDLYKHIRRVHSMMRILNTARNCKKVWNNSKLDAGYIISDDENESSNTVRSIKITPSKEGYRFKCSSCDHVCRDSSNMKRHMQRMHGGMRIIPMKRRGFKTLDATRKNKDDVGVVPVSANEENRLKNETDIKTPTTNFWDYFKSGVSEQSPTVIGTKTKIFKVQRGGITMLEPVTSEKVPSYFTREINTAAAFSQNETFKEVISGGLSCETASTDSERCVDSLPISSIHDEINITNERTLNSNFYISPRSCTGKRGEPGRGKKRNSNSTTNTRGGFVDDDINAICVIDIPLTEGRTQYKCSKCELVSKTLGNIYKHMRRMHPDYPIKRRARKNKAWYS